MLVNVLQARGFPPTGSNALVNAQIALFEAPPAGKSRKFTSPIDWCSGLHLPSLYMYWNPGALTCVSQQEVQTVWSDFSGLTAVKGIECGGSWSWRAVAVGPRSLLLE